MRIFANAKIDLNYSLFTINYSLKSHQRGKMRIDKFLSNMGIASRTESSKAARGGLILVNGVPVKKADVHIDPEKDVITYCGRKIEYRKYTYIPIPDKQAAVL